MPRAISVRVGAKSDRPASGPKPFSQEWLLTPPEQRLPPPRRAPNLPSWVPSERVIAAILVLLLVFATVVVSGGPAPDTTAVKAASTGAAGEVAQATSTSAVLLPPPSPTVATTPTANQGETAAAAAPSATAVPATASIDDRALLPKYRIVSYYGHPADEHMGILGEFDKADLLKQLRDEAKAFEEADPSRPVMPAFEVIASVAQNWPADDNTYLLHTDEETIQSYVDFARDNGILLILDLQIGRSSVQAEIDRVSKWLVEPFVHIALDSEFAVGPDGVPGEVFGSLDASDIAIAQDLLSTIVRDNNLPPKLLIVHRFTEGMITNENQLGPVEGVQTVIDFDGKGDAPSKIEGYDLFLNTDYAQFAGIKLFYKYDEPLMQPEQVVALSRPPDVVVFQ